MKLIITLLLLIPSLGWGLTFKDGQQVDSDQNEVKDNDVSEFKKLKIFPEINKEQINYDYCSINYDEVLKDLEVNLNKNNGFIYPDKVYGNSGEKDWEKINVQLAQNLSQYLIEPSDKNADYLKKYINKLFDSKFMTKYSTSDDELIRDTSLNVKNMMLSLLYNYAALVKHNHLNEEEMKLYKSNIDQRMRLVKRETNDQWNMSRCRRHSDLFGCQNHIYTMQHLRGLYGFIFNKQSDQKHSQKLYNFAIDDLKSDGAMWREASRSKWSWRYYSHALGNLLGIAELHYLSNINVYDYNNKSSQSIHDAVGFFLKSITNNELMWSYSKDLKGVDHYKDYKNYKDLKYLKRLQEDGGAAGDINWLYFYIYRFPNHPNTKLALSLIDIDRKSIYPNHAGINAQCVYPNKDLVKNSGVKKDYSSLKSNQKFEEGLYELKWYFMQYDDNDRLKINDHIGSDIVEIKNDQLNFTSMGNVSGMNKDNRKKISINFSDGILKLEGNIYLNDHTSNVSLVGSLEKNQDGNYFAEGPHSDWDDIGILLVPKK